MNRNDRGNGYYEYDCGRFDAALVYIDTMIARTRGDVVIGYNLEHEAKITEWADEYDLPVEWHI